MLEQQDIVDNIYNKEFLGPTLGEVLQSVSVLKIEQKILRIGQSAGRFFRQYINDRANPKIKGSIPYHLDIFAEYLSQSSSNDGLENRKEVSKRIKNTLMQMPLSGNANARLNFLYNELYEDQNKRDYLFSYLTPDEQQRVSTFFDSIEKIVIAGLKDSSEIGYALPFSTRVEDWFSVRFSNKAVHEALVKQSINPNIQALTKAMG